ncbi:tRNA pseudouridine synthase A [Lactobacillaceae bacterium]|nr:tRNA pseudouridine synthase A [Lactobacillaceae bacterium]
MDNDFHARYSAHRKTYRYRVDQGEFVNPFKRNYTSHFKYPLNLEKMRKAANDLVGTHDFTSFVASGSQARSNVRTIENITIKRDELRNEVVFDFTGNGFLYNQVRIMVAFLLEIGSNQRPVDDVSRVLTAKDRTLARMTAPASGLYLVNVDYGTNDEKD